MPGHSSGSASPTSGVTRPPDLASRPMVAGGGPISLTAEDRAILALESPTVAGHACKVLVVDPGLTIEALRASIGGRLPAAPGMTWRLGGTSSAPAWEPVPGPGGQSTRLQTLPLLHRMDPGDAINPSYQNYPNPS